MVTSWLVFRHRFIPLERLAKFRLHSLNVSGSKGSIADVASCVRMGSGSNLIGVTGVCVRGFMWRPLGSCSEGSYLVSIRLIILAANH